MAYFFNPYMQFLCINLQPEYFMYLTVLHATCDYVRLHINTFMLQADIYESHVNIFTSHLIRLQRKKKRLKGILMILNKDVRKEGFCSNP